MTSDTSLPFCGGIMFMEMPEGDAATLKAQVEQADAMRRAHNAKIMAALPEAALTLDFKRVLAGKVLEQFIAKCDMPEGRLDAMTEEEIDGVIVAAVELEEILDDDHEELLAAMSKAKNPIPKP